MSESEGTQRSLDITVVIPTYNGADRIPAVLDKLRSQDVPDNWQWEVLVVDNNSQDNTRDVVKQHQENWPADVPLRYVFEARQGLAFARQCGIENAGGDLVGFLDDDNLPEATWVAAACSFAQDHPQAGAYGSEIEGQFESPPPADLQPILFYLALNKRGDQPIQYDPRVTGVPPGAGLVVRRHAWLTHVPVNLLLVGRVGQSMLAGEDAEALLYLHRAGWEIWYAPTMKIQHCISASRLTPTYLQDNLYGIGLCRHHLRMLALPAWQRPIMFWMYLLSDLRRVILHYFKHRSSLGTNVVATCEMKRLLGTFISPFYLFTLRWKS